MSLELLDKALTKEMASLKQEGRAKGQERVIVEYIPPSGKRGHATNSGDQTQSIYA